VDDPRQLIVFDCGSGLRELGSAHIAENRKPNHYHIFFSHFHWDHIQGLPFFTPAYDPSVKIDFYSPLPNVEKYLSGQMVRPYFPVQFDAMSSRKSFHLLKKDTTVNGRTVQFKKMNHPGDSYAYCVNENGKRLIYATDTELSATDFMKTEENASFFQGADMVIIDCQYTLGEAIDKYHWGHSAFSIAVDFAANWGIKHMVMFHHDPAYNDHKLYGILQSARWYLERANIKDIELTLAYEGLEISL
jgi:phosphoribosyl 1,2-cyclic phosphodiesterase